MRKGSTHTPEALARIKKGVSLRKYSNMICAICGSETKRSAANQKFCSFKIA